MKLSLAAINEFQELWLSEFGIELSDVRAREYAERLLEVTGLLLHQSSSTTCLVRPDQKNNGPP